MTFAKATCLYIGMTRHTSSVLDMNGQRRSSPNFRPLPIYCRLRYILGVWWPRKISNEELWQRTKQERIEVTIQRRKWRWIRLKPGQFNQESSMLAMRLQLLVYFQWKLSSSLIINGRSLVCFYTFIPIIIVNIISSILVDHIQ